MQDNNSPNNKSSFTPAPNPFNKSTVSPEDIPAVVYNDITPEQEQEELPNSDTQEVEFVGKKAEEKPESGTQEPQKKKSAVASFFDPGLKKEKKTEENLNEPNVEEQILMVWQASEFVQTHKPAGWYLGFAAFLLALIVVAIFTKQYITVGLFVIMGIAILIYANRPPRVLRYQVSNYGIYIGEKKYLYDDFASYYETSDYGQTVLELVPNRRFGTLVSLPPAEHQLEQLEDVLSKMLPKVQNKEDIIDRLFRSLRF